MSPLVSTNTQSPVLQTSVSSNEPHIVLDGGYPLTGNIRVAGSKNAALALIAGTLLAATGRTVLHNLPNITDITDLVAILNSMGAVAQLSEGNTTLTVDASECRFNEPPPHLVSRMRGSLQLLGPLIARQGIVRLEMPGG